MQRLLYIIQIKCCNLVIAEKLFGKYVTFQRLIEIEEVAYPPTSSIGFAEIDILTGKNLTDTSESY